MSNTPRTWRVCAAQTGSVAPDGSAAMAEQACERIAAAAGDGVDLIVFPELFLSPFFANTLDPSAQRYFTTPEEPPLRTVIEAVGSAGINAVIPFAERGVTGLYNSACVVDRNGRVIGTYRKTHIPAYFPDDGPGGTGSYERLFFKPGEALPVFELDGVRIGVLICYDRLFPEAARTLALRGAEVICMPISYSGYSDPDHREGIWTVPIRARAYENGAYVIAANRVGREGPRRHTGRSLIVDPIGTVLREAPGDAEVMLCESLDLSRPAAVRYKVPFWRDRRPDLYAVQAAADEFGTTRGKR